jgi:hypothetical protein
MICSVTQDEFALAWAKAGRNDIWIEQIRVADIHALRSRAVDYRCLFANGSIPTHPSPAEPMRVTLAEKLER